MIIYQNTQHNSYLTKLENDVIRLMLTDYSELHAKVQAEMSRDATQ